MLFEVDKLLMQYPELWAIYDNNPLSKNKDVTLLATARREAFLYQHFNMFDVVRDYYTNIISRDKTDEDHWRAWENYIRQFFLRSSEACRLFKESRTQEIYAVGLREYINGMIDQNPVNND